MKALSASRKILERENTSSLTAQLKPLEQKWANTPKSSRWQEIIKLRVEVNQVETKKTTKNQQTQELVLGENKHDRLNP
jgi:acyl-homoserine lactone acylase PvdQ